jgi:hypothetical protein
MCNREIFTWFFLADVELHIVGVVALLEKIIKSKTSLCIDYIVAKREGKNNIDQQ